MERTYKINLTKSDLNAVINSLSVMPYREVHGLIGSLIAHAKAQDAEAAKDAKPAVKDES